MRADRLVAIVLLLQTQKKLTAQALAARLEVSPRTILRDVEALSRAGIPIYSNGGRGGGIMLDEHYRVTLTGLKEAEIQTLAISSNAQIFRDIGLGDAAENAQLKVSAAMPIQYQPSVEFMRQRIYIDPLWWWHDSNPLPFWGEILQAVYTSRCIHAAYEHYHGEITEQILEPYSLVAKSSTWYLIAQRDGEMRTYHTRRFHNIVPLDTYFCRSDDFDLATYWHQHLQEFASTLSDYAFILRIHENRLPFLRRLIPGRYTISESDNSDGWMIAQCHVESPDLAQMLVFGLRNQVTVIDPPELQAAVVQAAREILSSIG